jgi:hypothetical protein
MTRHKVRTDLLDAWLDRVDASKRWEFKLPSTGDIMAAHIINCQLVITLRYAGRNGWELFVPPSNSNKISDTLDHAAMMLGVEGCRGLVEEGSD